MDIKRRVFLLKITAARLVELEDYLKSNPDQFDSMERLDKDAFEKYKNTIGDFGQDKEDLISDFEQPGAAGIGVEGDSGLEGHVYGYNMTEDEFPPIDPEETSKEDLEEEFGVKFYATVPHNFPKIFWDKVDSGKVFYASNFVLEKHRTQIVNVLNKFLDKLRTRGYEYVCFDALSDTFKLFMDGSTPKQERLKKFKLRLIAIIPDPDEGNNHAQVLMEL